MNNTKLLESAKALLVTNPTNIRYLTGFVGVAPEEREAFALVTKNKKFLFTNSLYGEQAKKLKSEFIEISRENPFNKKLSQVLASQDTLLRGYRLGFEGEDLTVAEFQKLKKELKGVTLVPTKNRIEEMRMIKRDDEIENIRQATRLTDKCFELILRKLKPGVTESEIAWEIISFFRGQTAFSPIVAFGANSSQPHYQSSIVKLQLSDIILLDFGAKINGYCSDMTRVVFIGKPKDEWKRAYQAVSEAQQKALEYLTGSRPVNGRMADSVARNHIKKLGFPPYPHSLGHGVGLAIHEQPRLSYKKDVELLPGMVVTVEPAIYVEGRYGIRIEDLVLLKKDGIEILSKSPKRLTIL